jgi:hypothetical protein
MKRIPLSNGGEALVDDADYPLLSRWKWTKHKQGYASRTTTGSRVVLMHRQIMGEPDTDVEHKNRERLDNQRSNLRVATHSQNMHNRPKQRNNTSGHKGVYWDKQRRRWLAKINVAGVEHNLGRFVEFDEAVRVRRAAADRLLGEFVCH